MLSQDNRYHKAIMTPRKGRILMEHSYLQGDRSPILGRDLPGDYATPQPQKRPSALVCLVRSVLSVLIILYLCIHSCEGSDAKGPGQPVKRNGEKTDAHPGDGKNASYQPPSRPDYPTPVKWKCTGCFKINMPGPSVRRKGVAALCSGKPHHLCNASQPTVLYVFKSGVYRDLDLPEAIKDGIKLNWYETFVVPDGQLGLGKNYNDSIVKRKLVAHWYLVDSLCDKNIRRGGITMPFNKPFDHSQIKSDIMACEAYQVGKHESGFFEITLRFKGDSVERIYLFERESSRGTIAFIIMQDCLRECGAKLEIYG